jgi:hypothetical protein
VSSPDKRFRGRSEWRQCESCTAAPITETDGSFGPIWTDERSDYASKAEVIVSTPCQPAYAIFARSAPVKEGECRSISEWKMLEIKGLVDKSLKSITNWNRWGFGS